MARRAKTLKAVANITARFTATTGKVEYALSAETSQWYVREHLTPANESPYTTKWGACKSPLEALGLRADALEGDCAFEVRGRSADCPRCWGKRFLTCMPPATSVTGTASPA